MKQRFSYVVFVTVAIMLLSLVLPIEAFSAVEKRSFGQTNTECDPLQITCPDDITIECSQSADPTVTGFPTITGGCPPFDTTYVDERCPGSGHVLYIIARTWIVTDCQGMQAVCSQSILVVDNTPPQITCPPDVEFSCDNVGDFGEPVVEDNCDRNPTVTYVDSIIYMHDPEVCPYEYVMIRTWTATDRAGNSSSCTQKIVISDSEAPRITFCPEDQTVACDDEIASLPHATAVDNCNPELDQVPLEYSYQVIRKPGGGPCEHKIIRLWEFHDGCCNRSVCQQVVTVKDTIPPTLVCAPDDTIGCQEEPIFTDPEISDNCTLEPTLTVVLTDTIVDPTGGGLTLRRCWKGIDDCGNESDTCCQRIYQPFCMEYCSFTIGGWGSKCPRSQADDPYSTQPGCIRDHYFDQVFPEGVTIGVEGDPDGHFAKWITAEAVKDFLPDGGTPSYLTSDLINPTTTPAGVLASQVLALHLNREYSCYGVFQTVGLSSGISCYGDFVIPDDCGKFAGMTVDEFLEIADLAVGGKLDVLEPYSATLSDVNCTATCLNELYVDCHRHDDCHCDGHSPGDCDSCATHDEGLSEDKVAMSSQRSELSLHANPNPVAGKTMITFSLPASGSALLEIYDIQGRRIKTLTRARLDEGLHSVTWYGDDDNGKPVSPGVYFCRLRFETGSGKLEKLIKL